MRDPDTLDDLSKDRFEGTVLRAISKSPKVIKKELGEEGAAGGAGAGQTPLGQVREQPAEVLQNPGLTLEFGFVFFQT